MSTVTYESTVPSECVTVSEETIRTRVAQIQSRWSPAERARRAVLGRARRDMLLTPLGLITQATCA